MTRKEKLFLKRFLGWLEENEEELDGMDINAPIFEAEELMRALGIKSLPRQVSEELKYEGFGPEVENLVQQGLAEKPRGHIGRTTMERRRSRKRIASQSLGSYFRNQLGYSMTQADPYGGEPAAIRELSSLSLDDYGENPKKLIDATRQYIDHLDVISAYDFGFEGRDSSLHRDDILPILSNLVRILGIIHFG